MKIPLYISEAESTITWSAKNWNGYISTWYLGISVCVAWKEKSHWAWDLSFRATHTVSPRYHYKCNHSSILIQHDETETNWPPFSNACYLDVFVIQTKLVSNFTEACQAGNKSPLVQVMAWSRTGTKTSPEPVHLRWYTSPWHNMFRYLWLMEIVTIWAHHEKAQ